MPSPAAQAESAALRATTQVALARLAANAYEQAGELWLAEVKAYGSASKAAASWVGKMLRALRIWRRQAMEIASAHQALDEGLRTGRVTVAKGRYVGSEVSARKLRTEYRKVIESYAKGALAKAEGFEPWTGSGPAAVFEVEHAQELRKVFDEIEAAWAKEAEEQLRKVATANAKQAGLVKVRANATDPTADLDERRAKAQELAAQKAGTAVAHNVQSAARDANFRIANAGPNVIGWARKSFPINGSQPCAFCLLSLSRGASYKTGKTAGGDIGGPYSFHPNCRCQAVPIYRGENYKTMPEFEENRQAFKFYKDNYPHNGKSEKARFNAFRRKVDARNRANKKS